jgi:ABC-type multidrug transport system fused ATPase/permease subunit
MNERSPSLLRLAQRVWTLFDRAQKRECVRALLLSIAAGCTTVAGVAGIAPFLAALAEPSVVQRNAALAWLQNKLDAPSLADFIVLLGLGFVVLLVFANVVNLLAARAINRFGQRAGACFHALLFEEYLRRDLTFHARTNSDVLATQVVNDVNRTVGGVIHSGLTLITSLFAISLIAAAVIVIDPLVALGAALVLGASYGLIYFVVRRRLVRDGAMTAQLWSMRAKVIAESFESIKDIIIFRAHEEVVAQVARQSDAIAAAHARVATTATSPRYVLECVTAAGLVFSALWIYRSAGPGQWLTHLALLGLAAYRLLPPIQQAFAAVARIRTDAAAFERIADDLRHARALPRPAPAPPAAREWASRPLREIRLIGVSYRHAPERDSGISDVSLRIRAGTFVGLAGANGSGKTTLADVILGLLVPDGGEVQVDGVALDERNRKHWLTAVAHVPQNIVLLDATVARNVAFGSANVEIDSERVKDALRDARLQSAIDELPHGIETMIGQNGAHLSGGQRQRLGIARALYRRAPLLVLDEATSALDTAAEAEIIALLRGLRGRCTILLIAHRPSSLQDCDEVFELDGGRLVGRRPVIRSPRVSGSIECVDNLP